MLFPEVRVLYNSSANVCSYTNCSSGGISFIRMHKVGFGSTPSISSLALRYFSGGQINSSYASATCFNGMSDIRILKSHDLSSFRPRERNILIWGNRAVQLNSTHSHTFSTSSSSNEKSGSKAVSKSRQDSGGGQVTLSMGEKVKENAKTATYGGVIVLGIVVTCAMGYLILSELFSDESPNNIYTKSFKLCKANQEVQDVLGAPIKCYGEETRKGWRRHVAHQQFLFGNTKILRMRFYLEGKFNKATVHVEKKSNESGKYEYSYLVVDVDGYPTRRIVIDT